MIGAMTVVKRIFRFPPAALLLLLPILLLMMACSGGPAGPPRAGVTINPPPTATPAPSALPPTPAAPALAEPPADVPFTHIAAGKWHGCGLREDATVLCWGRRSDNGELDPPPQVKFRQLAAGLQFTCGLREDGGVLCWGANDEGQAIPPRGEFTAVAAGRRHACALDVAGIAVCWGEGYGGGWKIEAGGVVFTAIDSGNGYSCGLTRDKDLRCWDNNESPEITPGPFRELAAGVHHRCALREDGSARCQGNNRRRQTEPPPAAFTAIAAGWHHSCGITAAGYLECWGAGQPGAPGQRLEAPDGEFTALSVGWRHSCGLRPGGYAVCWYQTDISVQSSSPFSPSSPHLAAAFGGRVFDQPVDLFPWPDGGLAVVEREGMIRVYADPPDEGAEPDGPPPRPVLDLTASVDCCRGEEGMLSAAADPEFEEFPYLYVYYIAPIGNTASAGRLSRFTVVDGYARADSELMMLEFYSLGDLHYGGAVRFGPDGMLYLGIGDNGFGDKAQDLGNLRGKIIRIDRRGATAEQPYRAPADNPFVNTPGARPEIWAYGLRNPWRMAFDRQGRLFVTDVGTRVYEEVSIAAAGANLGWPALEGNHCLEDSAEICAAFAAESVAPIHSYRPAPAPGFGCAIIGGAAVPWLGDGFVFGDFCLSELWLLSGDGAGGWEVRQLAQIPDRRILSIAMGDDETVYALTANGPVMRLERSVAAQLSP